MVGALASHPIALALAVLDPLRRMFAPWLGAPALVAIVVGGVIEGIGTLTGKFTAPEPLHTHAEIAKAGLLVNVDPMPFLPKHPSKMTLSVPLSRPLA